MFAGLVGYWSASAGLNSSVYRRFGTVSFAIPSSVHQNIIKRLMYVETGQGQPEPHEETEEEQIKREGADTIALDSGPVDTERWHRHP
jgi:hypothetical protein